MNFDYPKIRIDYRDWMRGNNLYDDYPNGGLKRDSVGYNPFKYPGLLVASANRSETAVTASLVRSPFVTWHADSWINGGGGGAGAVGIGVNADPYVGGTGTLYWMNPTTAGMVAVSVFSGNSLSRTYRKGFSYMANIGSFLYVTSTNGMTLLGDSTGGATFDENYDVDMGIGSFTDNVPHPFARLDDHLYVADDNDIHEVSESAPIEDAFSLDASFTITELCEHRGYLMIAATEDFSYSVISSPDSVTARTETRLVVWDGFSEGYLDFYRIPNRITAMVSAPDRLYIWTTKAFGYLSGTDFIPLKDIENVVYRDDIVVTKNGFLYADGTKLIRYESVIPGGTKRFFTQEVYTKNIVSLVSYGNEKIQVMLDGGSGNAGININYGSYRDQTSGTREFEFNKKMFGRTVKVRKVVVETEGLGTGYVTIKYKDMHGTTVTCGTNTSSDPKMSSRRKWNFDGPGGDVVKSTSEITPLITLSGTAKLKSIEFYYEAADDLNNT